MEFEWVRRDGAVRIISARLATTQERKRHESQSKKNYDELRPEYNFDYSKAVRGKYYKRILADAEKKRVIDQRLADAHITPLWYPDGEHEHVEQVLELLLDYE